MFNPFENISLDDEEDELGLDFSEIRGQWVLTPPPQAPKLSSHGSGGADQLASKFPRSFGASGTSSRPFPSSPAPEANAQQTGINLGQGTPPPILGTVSSTPSVGSLGSGDDDLEKPKKGSGISKRQSFERRRDTRRTTYDGRGRSEKEQDDRFAKAVKGGGHKRGDSSSEVQSMVVGQVFAPNEAAFTQATATMRASALSSGAQAAVVKMVSTGGGRGSAAAMVNYNSREGKEALEKENGELVLTLEDQKAMLDDWEQFFDKREPSKDVTTLAVNFDSKLSENQQRAFREAVEAEYQQQRVVSGFSVDDSGNAQFVAVISIASKGKGRIKTTDHAKDKVQKAVEARQQDDKSNAVFAYGEAGHGVAGLENQLKSAIQKVGALSGPKDEHIETGNAAASSKRWVRDLRSYGNRDLMHLVISSKVGTDEKAFVDAVRDFLGSEFANNKYAFVLHGPNDSAVDKKTGESKATEHVHVHAMIVMKDVNSKRLDPKIQDFKRWREGIAHHARRYGINMVASNRTETLNAPNFTKGEHEMVKANIAPENIKAKVIVKQKGEAIAPRKPAGIVNANVGNDALKALVRSSRENGNEPLALEAARLAKRYDVAFNDIQLETVAAKRGGDIGGVVNALQNLTNMIISNSTEDFSMAQNVTLDAAVDRIGKTAGKISESLAGDPGLKLAFDAKIKPQLDALKSAGENSKTNQDLQQAVRSRTVEAQASENAAAYAQQAVNAGDTSAGQEKASLARASRAQADRAGSNAEAAEDNLRTDGIPTQPIKEAATQVVAADEIRPDIETPQNKVTLDDDNGQTPPSRGDKPRGGRGR